MPSGLRPAHLIAAIAAGLCAWELATDGGAGVPAAAPPWRLPLAARETWPFPRPPGGDPRAIPVPAPPQRIVAASITSAEILLAMAPRARLAAVHFLATDPRYCAAAAAAQGLATVGAAPEQLLAVGPDLLVTDPFTRAETQLLLESAGAVVVRTPEIRGFDDIVDAVRAIGWCCGLDAEAERLVAGIATGRDQLRATAGGLVGWRVMNLNGALETYGRGSLLDAVLDAAGAHNAAAEHGVGPFAVLDVEAVLAFAPDALLVAAEPGPDEIVPPWLRQRPGLRALPCVQRGRVLVVPQALLGTTSQHAIELAAFVQRRLAAWGRP